MMDLTLHAVQWCSQHGHPMLALRTTDARYFVVAMTTDDAVALATMPDALDTSRPPRRLYRLLEAMLAALGAHLTEIHLHVGTDAVLRASLHGEGPGGEIALPAHFADGVALAYRGQLPLRMPEEDLARVPLAVLGEQSAWPEGGRDPLAMLPETPLPPAVFREVIDGLDLDGFGA